MGLNAVFMVFWLLDSKLPELLTPWKGGIVASIITVMVVCYMLLFLSYTLTVRDAESD